MRTVKKLSWLSFLVAGLAVTAIHAADEGEKKGPVTLSKALKLGVEELTEYTDPSEVGQDRAAHLYATAKRVETEHALALKNVALVITLDEWRQTISDCRQGSTSLAYIVNGGGTMYSHGAARDCAELEDFMAVLAKRLPIAEGKGDAKANKQIDDAIAFIKKLKTFESGDAKEDKEAKASLAAEVAKVTEHWTSLKYMISEIPTEDAKRIATFAVDSLSWLKEGEN